MHRCGGLYAPVMRMAFCVGDIRHPSFRSTTGWAPWDTVADAAGKYNNTMPVSAGGPMLRETEPPGAE